MLAVMRRARTNSFDHTITGLLTKRADLCHEAERLRDRLGQINNDIVAIDHVLATFGHEGDIDAQMPRRREERFGRNELSRLIADQMRQAEGSLSSRAIASQIIAQRGEDAGDRKYLAEMTRRVSKALRHLRERGRVQSKTDARGNLLWMRRVD